MKNIDLAGLDPIRKRPSFYIGDVGEKGFHQLLWLIAEDSFSEISLGYGGELQISISEDGRTATVEDDGRGFDVRISPFFGKSSLEVTMSTLQAGKPNPSESRGCNAAIVNALSSQMTVEVKIGGKIYRQSYVRGIPITEVEEIGLCAESHIFSNESGLKITFTPDPEIFGEDLIFDVEKIRNYQ